jgi:phosphatidylserine decarboxylase
VSVEIFISSLVLAVVPLSLLAWKWNVKIRIAICGAVVFGVITGLIVNWIDTAVIGLHMGILILIELALIAIFSIIIIPIRFYRDPERTPKETENVILSPADGKVIYINSIEKGSSLVSTKGKRQFELEEIASTDLFSNAIYLLGIDMNILNVHVNRSPISGKVILRKRTKGSFISLRRQESEIVNERVTTVIDNNKFKIGVIQIASRLVRKIVSFIGEGDDTLMGQRLGAILFGSQVDVVFPPLENLRIVVEVGDEVKAGVSVIARYNLPADSQNR